jgi:hypothetical protein
MLENCRLSMANGIALARWGDEARVDDLPRHGDMASGPQRRVERWTVKFTKATPREGDHWPSVDLANPSSAIKIMSRSIAALALSAIGARRMPLLKAANCARGFWTRSI